MRDHGSRNEGRGSKGRFQLIVKLNLREACADTDDSGAAPWRCVVELAGARGGGQKTVRVVLTDGSLPLRPAAWMEGGGGSQGMGTGTRSS